MRERRVVAALAAGELAADRRRQAVMERRFDEQLARVRGADLGDLAQPARLAAAVLGRHEPDMGGERVG